MPKRVFLIHGLRGSPNGGYLPWLKFNLEEQGYSVSSLAMPDPANPKMGAWVGKLSSAVGKPDRDCYFVGHSLGCITILRYLETLKKGEKVGGAVLVAGFSNDLGYAELGSFFQKQIDWKGIISHCSNFVCLNSDNDDLVPIEQADLFREKLGAEIVVKQLGHFDVDELQDALFAVLRISNPAKRPKPNLKA